MGFAEILGHDRIKAILDGLDGKLAEPGVSGSASLGVLELGTVAATLAAAVTAETLVEVTKGIAATLGSLDLHRGVLIGPPGRSARRPRE